MDSRRNLKEKNLFNVLTRALELTDRSENGHAKENGPNKVPLVRFAIIFNVHFQPFVTLRHDGHFEFVQQLLCISSEFDVNHWRWLIVAHWLQVSTAVAFHPQLVGQAIAVPVNGRLKITNDRLGNIEKITLN